MRLPVRISRLSIWARRIARLVLPVLVISIMMHRAGMLSSELFNIIAPVTLLAGIVSLLLGLLAWSRLWVTGDRGWGAASFAVVVGLVCAVPAVSAAVMGLTMPMVRDVSTDIEDPPGIVGTLLYQDAPSAPPSEIARTFPDAVTRHYPMGPVALEDHVRAIALNWGWQVIAEVEPGDAGGATRLNMIDMTLWGWRDEVVIRLAAEPGGTALDMRSVSYAAGHDLGRNGQRIEAFLKALDERLAEAEPAEPPAPEQEVDADIVADPPDEGEGG